MTSIPSALKKQSSLSTDVCLSLPTHCLPGQSALFFFIALFGVKNLDEKQQCHAVSYHLVPHLSVFFYFCFLRNLAPDSQFSTASWIEKIVAVNRPLLLWKMQVSVTDILQCFTANIVGFLMINCWCFSWSVYGSKHLLMSRSLLWPSHRLLSCRLYSLTTIQITGFFMSKAMQPKKKKEMAISSTNAFKWWNFTTAHLNKRFTHKNEHSVII